MLLKVAEINKLLTFKKGRHFIEKKKFRLPNFVSVQVTMGSLKICHKIGRSFHKFSRKWWKAKNVDIKLKRPTNF